MARKKIPDKTQQEVVTACRRKCCLCVFLDHDIATKKIQIAHLDRNSQNNDPDNLAALCLEHHADYDAKFQQAKQYTAEEVRSYRNRLVELMKQKDEALRGPISSVDVPLLNVIKAVEREEERHQKRSRVTGQELKAIALRALQHDGDLDAVETAFVSLIRLAAETHTVRSVRSPGKRLDPIGALIELLEHAWEADGVFFCKLLDRLRRYHVTTEDDLRKLSNFSDLPGPYLSAAFSTLACFINKPETDPGARDQAIKRLAQALASLAYLARLQGLEVRERQIKFYISCPWQQEKDTEEYLFPVAFEIANMSEKTYERILDHLRYKAAILLTDQEETLPLNESLASLKRIAVLPNEALFLFPARENRARIESEVGRIMAAGTEAAFDLRILIAKTRSKNVISEFSLREGIRQNTPEALS